MFEIASSAKSMASTISSNDFTCSFPSMIKCNLYMLRLYHKCNTQANLFIYNAQANGIKV